MARQTRGILTDAVSQGLGIDDVTKSITERIGVSKSNAARIARTETIQAYQRSHINNAREVEERTGNEVLLRWITARDARVRDQHARWHGKVMTATEAATNIQVSPYNCRCALVELIPEANTPAKQAEFNRERTELLDEERT